MKVQVADLPKSKRFREKKGTKMKKQLFILYSIGETATKKFSGETVAIPFKLHRRAGFKAWMLVVMANIIVFLWYNDDNTNADDN